MQKSISLLNIVNREGTAQMVTGESAALAPIDDLPGWEISVETFDEVGIDRVILTCRGDAAVNPLHSGGDVHWLGFLEEGPLELILGDSEGNRHSARLIQPGEYMTFAPDTYHGWIPKGHPARLIFIKLKT